MKKQVTKQLSTLNSSSEIKLNDIETALHNMEDAEVIRLEKSEQQIELIYIRTLVNQERLNESIIMPFHRAEEINNWNFVNSVSAKPLSSFDNAISDIFTGCVILYSHSNDKWISVTIPTEIGRAIESSETETILYGPKDSFSEQVEQNIALIRKRLPIAELKTEQFNVGTLTKTQVVMMYIDGITNPDYIEITRQKLSSINYDIALDASQIIGFMEDHYNSLFPQYQQTDRPDMCSFSLSSGKIIILVNNTPFAIVAPITIFDLFHSPEDYINRWIVASFMRLVRYFSFFTSLFLIPFYVALSTYHYQMIPLQTLSVLMDSRSKMPFGPFWEAIVILITLEIIKEASLRMPTKTGQTLGVIGGIVIGEAAVQAGFVSNVLIVLVGISAISSFLMPNYLLTKSITTIKFVFLVLAGIFGLIGLMIGFVIVLSHLNRLTSLKQPYMAPVSPFYKKDWIDLIIRGPFHAMKTRPSHLHTVKKWRIKKGDNQ